MLQHDLPVREECAVIERLVDLMPMLLQRDLPVSWLARCRMNTSIRRQTSG